jgi:hypothetical protein
MAELLLVNPKRRKRRAGARRNPRKMTAKQAKYFAPRRRKRRSGNRVSATAAPRVSRRRRSHRKGRRSVSRFLGSKSGALSLKPNVFLKDTLIPSAIGGAGALLVDFAWANVPGIPTAIKAGPMGTVAKAAAAVGIGLLASKFAGKKIGSQVTSGYLTVLAYNTIKGMVQKAMPTLQLGDYGWIQSGPFVPDPSMGVYVSSDVPALVPPPSVSADMGAYVSGYDDSYYS